MMKIFRLKFLKSDIKSLTNETDSYVREGYYGGATDYYKKHGTNLYYYDINSLYSSQMLKDMPVKELNFIDNLKSLDNFFGFALVEVHCPKHIKTPVLPFRSKEGTVIYPRGV